jgi:hypothetical protein
MGGVEVAVAERFPPRLAGARKGAIHHRHLEHTGREEQPFQIGPALRTIERYVEARLGKRIGQIGADRRAFGDDLLSLDLPSLGWRIGRGSNRPKSVNFLHPLRRQL